jgi:hypothetical protein
MQLRLFSSVDEELPVQLALYGDDPSGLSSDRRVLCNRISPWRPRRTAFRPVRFLKLRFAAYSFLISLNLCTRTRVCGELLILAECKVEVQTCDSFARR